jgi:hypothetical protein
MSKKELPFKITWTFLALSILAMIIGQLINDVRLWVNISYGFMTLALIPLMIGTWSE